MKFKVLAATFLASAALAGCGSAPSTPEEVAAAQATAFDVTCRDNLGTVTFQGVSQDGIGGDSSSTSRHVVIKTLEGGRFEQYGGTCTALKRAP